MLRPKGGLREARHSLRDSGEYVERAGLSRLPPLVEDLIAMVSRFAGKLYGVSRKYEGLVEDARRLVEDT